MHQPTLNKNSSHCPAFGNAARKTEKEIRNNAKTKKLLDI